MSPKHGPKLGADLQKNPHPSGLAFIEKKHVRCNFQKKKLFFRGYGVLPTDIERIPCHGQNYALIISFCF